jgi:3-deoxy-D-arabino-heptulosonate 7-phosphate (DAHP) synthase class II
MVHDIPMPEISAEFTVDDIHRIREWNYERLKDATVNERLEDINKGAEEGLRRIEAIRAAHKAKAV